MHSFLYKPEIYLNTHNHELDSSYMFCGNMCVDYEQLYISNSLTLCSVCLFF